MPVESIPGFDALPERDKDELRQFDRYLRRRTEHPDEPEFHAYAEVYGEVVFEDGKNGGDRG